MHFKSMMYMNVMRERYDISRDGSGYTPMGTIGMTAGTIFLMWLGEQIDEYGIGNGISLLIMAGILARMPGQLRMFGKIRNLRSAFQPGIWAGNADFSGYGVCFCRRRHDSHYAGTAENSDSAGQTDAGNAVLWRAAALSAAEG